VLISGNADPSHFHSRQREHFRESVKRENQRRIREGGPSVAIRSQTETR
jgi:hypothetical protein